MSLIAELKRRNVFRVGVAYAIVGWLLIEVASTAFATLHATGMGDHAGHGFGDHGFSARPGDRLGFRDDAGGNQAGRMLIAAESIRHHVRAASWTSRSSGCWQLLVVYFAVDKFVLETRSDRQPSRARSNQLPREKSIAVLPFVNMSSDPEQEHFSDGLSEEILNLLAKVPELKVIGRTSSFAFKGKNEDLRVIGQTLGVTTVLEGSVRKSGDRVRVTAQLIDVSDGSHLWSETYDRTMTDIFAIQDDVAAAIIDALQIHVGTKPTRGRPTDNIEAYALFFQARVSLNAKDPRKC